MLGLPGAGKGTIAELIEKKYNLTHFSAGEYLRKEVKQKTKIGLEMKKYMDKGQLGPPEFLVRLTNKFLKHIKKIKNKGIIFDGFPRSLEQINASKNQLVFDTVINLDASEKTIMERLGGRLTCPKCGAIYHVKNAPPKAKGKCDKDGTTLIQRDDDKPKAIKERIKSYNKQTKPLVDFFKKEGLLIKIDASDNPKNILKRVEKKIKFS